MIQLIQNSSFKKMPWKNGQGVTTQIRIDPEDADFTRNNFHFRLSSAPIEKDGEFSVFPGMERILIPIKGAGFQLNDDIYEKFEVARFPGNQKTYCRLLKGSVIDFGIIFAPQFVDVKIKILHLKSDMKFSLDPQNRYFLSVLDGVLIHDNKTLMPLETICYFNEENCRITINKSAVVCFATMIFS